MNPCHHPRLSRFEVYAAWRAACDAGAVLREVIGGSGAILVAAHVYARFAADCERIRGLLDTASPPLPDAGATTPRRADRAILDALERVTQDLGTLALDGSRIGLAFTPTRTPVAVEKVVLTAALTLDDVAPVGELVGLWQLAGAANHDITAIRRVACQWCDEGLVYMSCTRITRHAPEGILLLDAARRRAEDWDAYQRDRAPDRAAADPAPPAPIALVPANGNHGATAVEASLASVASVASALHVWRHG